MSLNNLEASTSENRKKHLDTFRIRESMFEQYRLNIILFHSNTADGILYFFSTRSNGVETYLHTVKWGDFGPFFLTKTLGLKNRTMFL